MVFFNLRFGNDVTIFSSDTQNWLKIRPPTKKKENRVHCVKFISQYPLYFGKKLIFPILIYSHLVDRFLGKWSRLESVCQESQRSRNLFYPYFSGCVGSPRKLSEPHVLKPRFQ